MSGQAIFRHASEGDWTDLGGGSRRRVLLHRMLLRPMLLRRDREGAAQECQRGGNGYTARSYH